MNKGKTILFSDYDIAPPSPQMKQTHTEAAMNAFGRVPRRDHFLGQLSTQLSYMGLWFWLGIPVLCAVLYLAMTRGHLWVGEGHSPALPTLIAFSVSGPMLASLSAPVLSRSFSHDMWELENASFHNLSRLTAIRLILCGLGALPVMLPLALAGLSATGGVVGMTALLAPFLLANGLNYGILGRLRGNAGTLCCIGANLAVAWACTLPVRRLSLFHVLQSGGVKLICVLMLLLCAGSFVLGARDILKKVTL